MTEPKWVSPNEIMSNAKDIMLQGREPVSRKDWELIVNFIAFNLPTEVAESVSLIMKTLYKIPLPDERIKAIAQYQIQYQQSEHN